MANLVAKIVVYFILVPLIGIQNKLKVKISNEDFQGKLAIFIWKAIRAKSYFPPLAMCSTKLRLVNNNNDLFIDGVSLV